MRVIIISKKLEENMNNIDQLNEWIDRTYNARNLSFIQRKKELREIDQEIQKLRGNIPANLFDQLEQHFETTQFNVQVRYNPDGNWVI